MSLYGLRKRALSKTGGKQDVLKHWTLTVFCFSHVAVGDTFQPKMYSLTFWGYLTYIGFASGEISIEMIGVQIRDEMHTDMFLHHG